jgi:hypothetical protein
MSECPGDASMTAASAPAPLPLLQMTLTNFLSDQSLPLLQELMLCACKNNMDGSFSWKRHGLKNLVLDVFKNNFTFYGKRQLDENLGKVR